MAVVEIGSVKLTNNLTKVSRRIKAPEVEDEESTKEKKDSHMDGETPKTSNALTATSLDTASNCWHKDNEQAYVAEATNDIGNDSTLLLALDDSSSQYEAWYLDYCTSNNMYRKKDLHRTHKKRSRKCELGRLLQTSCLRQREDTNLSKGW